MKSLRVVAALAAVALACSSGGDETKLNRGSTSSTTRSSTTSTTSVDASSSTSSGSAGGATTPTTSPPLTNRTTARPSTTAAGRTPVLANAKVKLTRVASADQPLGVIVRPGGQLYVIEREGRVRPLNGSSVGAPLVDITSQVTTSGEGGLLGAAFSPDGAFVYLSFTNLDGDTRLWEYRLAGSSVDLGSRREVIAQDQPASNHNGGWITFGPDGRLYVGLGDGGGGGDTYGNSQRRDTLLAKLLRIDPRPSGSRPYGVPGDNPYVNDARFRPETFAWGLRNPWRFSFDRATGDLWLADVGQGAWEEVDFLRSGDRSGPNYGWNLREGTHPFNGGAKPPGAVDPVYEYSSATGPCSITGGYVYRGSRIPDLVGAYVFGDFCRGVVEALAQSGGRVGSHRDLASGVDNLGSFGEDASGELYVCSLGGAIYRLDPG